MDEGATEVLLVGLENSHTAYLVSHPISLVPRHLVACVS